jgi:transglutaminase-like putative cysteine protease
MTAITGTVVGALLLSGDGRSPAVAATDIKRQLSPELSGAVMFVVTSPEPAYWRVTALTDFDGTTWLFPSETHDASGPALTVDGRTLTQTFEIRQLGGPWLPAAFSPVQVEGPDAIVLETETSSLTISSQASNGLTYTVESVLPSFDAARLRAADVPPRGAALESHLALPVNFPADLVQRALDITAGAATRYDQALALQNYFRGFTYDASVPARAGHSAIRQFLAERRGFCQQFAGTFAVFARALGLPSRVAIGFTPGERRDDGRFYVQGKHAHAWPEVYFAGVGWVPFEPTPTRGNPAAEPYTGVAADQADDDE